MAAPPPGAKRRHTTDKKLGERRREKAAGSSRDASEEDNEDQLSDVGSLASDHVSRPAPLSAAGSMPPPHAAGSAPGISAAHRRALGQKKAEAEESQSDGVDSPVYDGDVESSSTIGGTPVHSTFLASASGRSPNATTSPTKALAKINLEDNQTPHDVPVAESEALSPPEKSQLEPPSGVSNSSSQGPMKMFTRPVELSPENISGFVGRAIEGKGSEDGVERWWKTNKPPGDRPVRIYADGVYDLFHFGHALQLRQAKLSFPKVHLLVGVCSDALCAAHKSAPSMTHAERCEAVRHCRWADEILPDAPWIVDQAWMDKHEIDYLAHDEEVYPTKGVEDVYAFAKGQGKFLPTRRTPCISTSDLLERIVRGYRDGFFDSKLEKNGHPELLAADVDWDSSASVDKREKRKKKYAQKIDLGK